MLEGSKIARGRKNRTNIRKHVVRNPAMLPQTISRRVLKTSGSGADSTTAAGDFGAGFAGGAAGPVVATVVCLSETLSTTKSDLRLCGLSDVFENPHRAHFNAGIARQLYNPPPTQGSVSLRKPDYSLSLEVRPRPKQL